MRKRLTKTENSLALVLDRPLLEATGIGAAGAALASALAFPWLNGQRLDAGEDELTEMVTGVASGRVGKAEAAVFISARLRSLS